MFYKKKYKLIDTLFKFPNIDINGLIFKQSIKERKDADILHYVNSLTGDNYVGKLFKPFLLNKIRKPGFQDNYGSQEKP